MTIEKQIKYAELINVIVTEQSLSGNADLPLLEEKKLPGAMKWQ